jgi:hypothetical protein
MSSRMTLAKGKGGAADGAPLVPAAELKKSEKGN